MMILQNHIQHNMTVTAIIKTRNYNISFEITSGRAPIAATIACKQVQIKPIIKLISNECAHYSSITYKMHYIIH